MRRLFIRWRLSRPNRNDRLIGFALLFVVLAAALFVMPRRGAEPTIAVWHAAANAVMEMRLEEYVRGVVAAEMPADFHREALKAQAVAARTYALRRIERGERLAEQSAAHVSSDFNVHQAWLSEDEYLGRWGNAQGAAHWERIGEAVDATRGLVLTYEGHLIEALYHSTSGGHTEDAAQYFQTAYPYLIGVPDPYGHHSPTAETRARFPLAAVLRRFGIEEVAAAEGPVIAVDARTGSGRAQRVVIADHVVSGRAVREALGLRSSWFDVDVEDGDAVFYVRGNGHGVGMSQYGADGMAAAGHRYTDILAYYYRGTVLERRY